MGAWFDRDRVDKAFRRLEISLQIGIALLLLALGAALLLGRTIGRPIRRRGGGLAPIRVRVGIHTGEVVVGNVGWPGRMNYTIVGDTANACQRLEAIGKEFDIGEDVTVLISGQTLAQTGAQFHTDHVGARRVKGKQEAIDIYRLTGTLAAA